MSSVILLFRRDLRITDQAALRAALKSGQAIVPLYIVDPELTPGGAAQWWLHQALTRLDEQLQRLGSRLILRRGDTRKELDTVLRESAASAIYLSSYADPTQQQQDETLFHEIQRRGIAIHRFATDRLIVADVMLNKAGQPYKVFTPFYKTCLHHGLADKVVATPRRLPPVNPVLPSLVIAELALLRQQPWEQGLSQHWNESARDVLATLEATLITGYPEQRDLPARHGTTRLSPWLHAGEISPRMVLARLTDISNTHPGAGLARGAEAITRQLLWREFAHYILHHFPHTLTQPFNPHFAKFPWVSDKKILRAWQRGETGIPIIDAGMRELWTTGWMHNRVRMQVASFLTKNALIHWREGADWFSDTLVDADIALNTLNWQWVAGCGVDAAPYFRIFNPMTQGMKFDPHGDYLRRWLPELSQLPVKYLHHPTRYAAEIRREHGIVIGRDYPEQILDLTLTRERALAAWRKLPRRTDA